MLDQIRRDIQARLDQLLSEADKLRRALAILGPRDGSKTTEPRDGGHAPSAPGRPHSPASRRRAATPPAGEGTQRLAGSQRVAASGDSKAGVAGRTAPGATKTAVLEALAGGDAMTAGEVASATGLGRASVSTTLSKLAKTGEITKASRGYQLASVTSGATVDGRYEEGLDT